MNDQDAQQPVEETTAVQSEGTDTNEVEQQSEPVSESREDVNTQTEGSDEVKAEPEEVKPTPGNNFNKLLEERSFKTPWEQAQEQGQVQAAQAYQAEAQGINVLQQYGYNGLQLEVHMMKEQQKWEKAENKYPILKEDPDLADSIYAEYIARQNAGENVTPESVAAKRVGYLDKYVEKVKSKTYEQAENDITQKTQVSTKAAKRSSSNGSSVDLNDLKERARKGDKQAMDEYLAQVL